MILFAGSDSGFHKIHCDFLKDRLGYNRGWDLGNTASMGVYTPKIAAVVVYHDWSPESGTICMSAAADGPWLDKETLYRMHAYPFEIGCQAIVLQVSERNKRMLRIAKAFGYDMTRVPRLRGRDEAEMICVLTEEAWRANKFTKAFLKKGNNIAKVTLAGCMAHSGNSK